MYRAATFQLKRDADAWAREIERQADFVTASGYAPPPKDATLAQLIDAYSEASTKAHGKTKTGTLGMLKREIGATRLIHLNDLTVRARPATTSPTSSWSNGGAR